MLEPHIENRNFKHARRGISKALSYNGERRGNTNRRRDSPVHVAEADELSIEDLIGYDPIPKGRKSSKHERFHKSMPDVMITNEEARSAHRSSAPTSDKSPEEHRKRMVYKKLLQHGSSMSNLCSTSSSSLDAGSEHSHKSGKALMRGLIRKTSQRLLMVGESTSKKLADFTALALDLETSTDGKIQESKTMGINDQKHASSKNSIDRYSAGKNSLESDDVLDNNGSSHRPVLKRTFHKGGKADLLAKKGQKSMDQFGKSKRSKKAKTKKDDNHYTSWERKTTRAVTGMKGRSPHKSHPSHEDSLKAASHHPRLERNRKQAREKAALGQDHVTPRHSWSPTRPQNLARTRAAPEQDIDNAIPLHSWSPTHPRTVARTRSNDPPLRRTTSDSTRKCSRKFTPSPKPPPRRQRSDHLDGMNNHQKDPRSQRPTLSRTQSDAILLHRIASDTRPQRPTRIQSLSPKRSSGRIFGSSNPMTEGAKGNDSRSRIEQEGPPHPRSSMPHIQSGGGSCQRAALRRVASDRPRRPKQIQSLSPIRSSVSKSTARDKGDKEALRHPWSMKSSSTSRPRSKSRGPRSSTSPKRSSVNQSKRPCIDGTMISQEEAIGQGHKDQRNYQSRIYQPENQSSDNADKRPKLQRSTSDRQEKRTKLQRSRSDRLDITDKRTKLQRSQSDRPCRTTPKMKGPSSSLSPKCSSGKQRRPDYHGHDSSHGENENGNPNPSRPYLSRASSAKLAPSRLDLRRTRSARLYRQNLLDLYSSSSGSTSDSFGKGGLEQDAAENERKLHQNSPTCSLRSSRSGRNHHQSSDIILRKSPSMRISRKQRMSDVHHPKEKKCEHGCQDTEEEQPTIPTTQETKEEEPHPQPPPKRRSQLEIQSGGVVSSFEDLGCTQKHDPAVSTNPEDQSNTPRDQEAREEEEEQQQQQPHPQPPPTAFKIQSGGVVCSADEEDLGCNHKPADSSPQETKEDQPIPQPSQETKEGQPTTHPTQDTKEEEQPHPPPKRRSQLELQSGGVISSSDKEYLGCNDKPADSAPQETLDEHPSTPLLTPSAA